MPHEPAIYRPDRGELTLFALLRGEISQPEEVLPWLDGHVFRLPVPPPTPA